MPYNILIVEDQPLIALNIQDAVEELGHRSVGIARDMYQAFELAKNVDVALVDVNLEDGPTGPIVGKSLAEADVAVLFMTSDPKALGDGVPGTLGILQKPVMDRDLIEAIHWVADRRTGFHETPRPAGLIEFPFQ